MDRARKPASVGAADTHANPTPRLMRKRILVRFQSKRLKEIAQSLTKEKPSNVVTSNLVTGTRLIRSWHGEVHEVLSTDRGYEYRRKNYRSLSKIAREITGTRWSGPAFFGIREKKT